VGELASAATARELLGDVIHSPLSPLAIELLGSGMPVGNAVVFRVGGYPQAVERQVRDLTARIKDHGGRPADAPETLWDDLAATRVDAMQREVVIKAAAPLSESVRLVEILQEHLAELRPSIWANAGNGVAYAGCDAPTDASALSAARAEVQGLGGNASLVVQRCPTVLKRALDVWGDPQGVSLMRALKTKLDPRGTLNPGRYVGAL
jgi:glycolate dehydrogenase FAD-binding subunit